MQWCAKSVHIEPSVFLQLITRINLQLIAREYLPGCYEALRSTNCKLQSRHARTILANYV